jgi:DNA-directed RNA polymerase specialized sigma24 family protein
MRSAAENVRELWIDEWKAIRAYAYRATQGILAGHKRNPLFPPPDTIEEISAEGIAEAYQTTTQNADRITAWEDDKKRRKVLLRFLRNGIRHAIAKYRLERARFESLEGEQTSPETSDDCAELILSLPPVYRKTAELLSQGKNPTEIAEEIGLNRTTVYRHQTAIGQILGFPLFCRWLQHCFATGD